MEHVLRTAKVLGWYKIHSSGGKIYKNIKHMFLLNICKEFEYKYEQHNIPLSPSHKNMLTILLATYNGEKYLAAQLDSLLAQTYTNFTVRAHDDASTDATWDILNEYKSCYPNKFHLTRSATNSGSAKENFLSLITTARDDYLMLCDQDDIWLPSKIEHTMAKMKAMEKRHPNTPLLVHTDLQVVDQHLNVINPSFRQHTKRNYNRRAFHQVLNINNATGCTIMYNLALAKLLTKPPKHCVMHDWWLKLVAIAFGKIDHVSEATMLYRQHGQNACGAKDVRRLSYKLNRLINGKELRAVLHETCRQAGCLLEIYPHMLTASQKSLLQSYSAIPQMGKLRRVLTLIRLRTVMPCLSRNIALFMFI